MSNEPAPRPSREPWLFLAACLVVAFLGQGARGLWETDEGRYAEPAREMLATGDWLVPRLLGQPHLTKPPGTYWAVAAGLALFGKNAFGARFLLGAAHAVSALCVRRIGRSLLGDAAGARAGWIWLAMIYPFAAGSALTTDAFHVASSAAAIACFLLGTQSRPLAWFPLAGLSLGAAALFKGPVAWLPFAGFATGWAVFGPRDRLRRDGAAAGLALGIMLAVTIGLGWFAWAWANVPGASEQFGRETAGRLTNSGDHEPHWFGWFVPILAAGTLPWTVPLARGLRHVWDDATGRMLVVWAAVPFVAHSAAPSKNWFYVVAVCVPLALVAARGARDADSPWPARPWLLGAWLALLVGLRAVTAIVPSTKDMRALSAEITKQLGGKPMPVAVLTGRELYGLWFYRDGDVVRLSTRLVGKSVANAELEDYAKERAARGEPWLLVREWGDKAERAAADALGDTATPVGRAGARENDPDAWTVLRVEPHPRKDDGR